MTFININKYQLFNYLNYILVVQGQQSLLCWWCKLSGSPNQSECCTAWCTMV